MFGKKRVYFGSVILLLSMLISGSCMTDISEAPADEITLPPAEPAVLITELTEDTALPAETVPPETSSPSEASAPPEKTRSAPQFLEPDTERFSGSLRRIFDENHVVGMSVAVFGDGKILYTRNLGVADKETERPCDDNTKYRCASVSKLVSTVVLMQLRDQGLIDPLSDLTGTVGIDYDYPTDHRIKLWHLLTHTSGLTDTYMYEDSFTAKYSIEKILRISHIGTVPGTFYNYSNFGAGTIGAIVEKLTGKYYHYAADELLFGPLGMDAGFVIDLIDDKESCATLYDYDGEVFRVPEWNRTAEYYESFGLGNSYIMAQCELIISAADLARIGIALSGDGTVDGVRVLSEDALDEMHCGYIDAGDFTMGLNIRMYKDDLVNGRTICGHPGCALGAVCGLYYDRDTGTGVAVLTNRSDVWENSENGVYSLLDSTVKETYECFFREAEPEKPEQDEAPESASAGLLFAGDNLIHAPIYRIANITAGGNGYEFSPAYENLGTLISEADIAVLNQETIISDDFEPDTYPTFCTPGEMARDMTELGFDVFSISNNHVLDKGEAGLLSTLELWSMNYPDVPVYGAYKNDEDMDNIRTLEKNGIIFAFLGYMEHTNGLRLPASSECRVIYTSEKELIERQVRKAAEISDCVVVSVHFGIEVSNYITDEQKSFSRKLAEWGADIIVGTQPHTVQSMEYIDRADGSRAFVFYCLGNFISTMDNPLSMAGILGRITVTKDSEAGIILSDPEAVPIVDHYDSAYSYVGVYPLDKYTPEMAAKHALSGVNYDFLIKLFRDNIPREYIAEDYLYLIPE